MAAKQDTAYYDSIAPGYDALHKEEQEEKLMIILDQLAGERLSAGPILDVGAGTGLCLGGIAQRLQREVVGIEPSAGMIAQYQGSHQLVKGCAEALPFPDDSFSAIISVTALQNMGDIPQGIAEMRRVVVRGGPLAVSCLKRSAKLKEVTESLAEQFTVENVVEEEKDLIFFCRK